jgi:hypothetical protein
MEKRKCLAFLFCLLLCYSLFQLTARAQGSSQASIFSQGSITYSPSNVNSAIIPIDWGDYNIFGDVRYGSGVQITHVDPTVLHNGDVSIRIDAHQQGVDTNHWREVDGNYISVKPGDHIVFTVWIKTGHSTLGQDGVSGNGGIMGFDYYGASGRLREHSSDNPRNDVDPTWVTYLDDPTRYVPFNSDWTLRKSDTIVPTQVFDDQTGQLATEPIIGIIPWLQASGYIVGPNHLQDEGQVWFADAVLYINPA